MYRVVDIGKKDAFFDNKKFLIGKIAETKDGLELPSTWKGGGYYEGYLAFSEEIPEVNIEKEENIYFLQVRLKKLSGK
jgi:hypothetical protein